jgi:hypothetical protein
MATGIVLTTRNQVRRKPLRIRLPTVSFVWLRGVVIDAREPTRKEGVVFVAPCNDWRVVAELSRGALIRAP